jgi:hypothetical protein
MNRKLKMNKEDLQHIKKIDEFFYESEKYFEEIGFYKKLEEGKNFSFEEVKQIIIGGIQKYFNREFNQNFVLGIGSIIFHDIIMGEQINGTLQEVEKIESATCSLNGLVFEIFDSKENQKSSYEIDLIIHNIFNELTGKSKKNKINTYFRNLN